MANIWTYNKDPRMTRDIEGEFTQYLANEQKMARSQKETVQSDDVYRRRFENELMQGGWSPQSTGGGGEGSGPGGPGNGGGGAGGGGGGTGGMGGGTNTALLGLQTAISPPPESGSQLGGFRTGVGQRQHPPLVSPLAGLQRIY